METILKKENIESIVDRHLNKWNQDRLEKDDKYYNSENFIKEMGTEAGKEIEKEIIDTCTDALQMSIKEFINHMK